MHFWIDKRSRAGRPHISSLDWSHEWRRPSTVCCHHQTCSLGVCCHHQTCSSGVRQLHETRPKRSCTDMPTPVHRYPAVPSAERETYRRLADHRPSSAGVSPSRPTDHADHADHTDRTDQAAVLLASPSQDTGGSSCAPFCYIIVITAIGIVTLTLTLIPVQTWWQRHCLLLAGFFFIVLLFFGRMAVLAQQRRTQRAAASASSSASAAASAHCVEASSHEPSWEGEPPPYHEAVQLPVPAPLSESPPPAYDKVGAQIHS